MKSVNESIGGRIEDNEQSSAELNMNATTFLGELKRYADSLGLYKRTERKDDSEEYPYIIFCNSEDSESRFRRTVSVYPFSRYWGRKGDIAAVDFSMQVCLMNGYEEDRVLIQFSVNEQKSKDGKKQGVSYKIPTELVACNNKTFEYDDMLSLLFKHIDSPQRQEIYRKTIIKDYLHDCVPSTLDYCKSLLRKIRDFIECDEMAGLILETKPMFCLYSEEAIMEKVMGIKMNIDKEDGGLKESIGERIIDVNDGDDLLNQADNAIDARLDLMKTSEFINRLVGTIESYRETRDYKSPYCFSNYEFSNITVWPNKFAFRKDNFGHVNICFDVKNSKKDTAFRILFHAHAQSSSSSLKKGKLVQTNHEPMICCYFEIKLAERLYQYTTSKSGFVKLKDTKSEFRLKGIKNDLFLPNEGNFKIVDDDLRYFLDSAKSLYKSYLKNDWKTVWADFYKNLPSNRKSVSESVGERVSDISSDMNLLKNADSALIKMDSVEDFGKYMERFKDGWKRLYGKVLFPKYPVMDKGEGGSIEYSCSKAIVYRFKNAEEIKGMLVDSVRFNFHISLWQHDISIFGDDDELNTPQGLFTTEFRADSGVCGKSHNPFYMFHSLDLRDDDFDFVNFKEERYKKPNFSKSLADNFNRFCIALGRTLTMMPKEMIKKMAETSKEFRPMPTEPCCKADGDKLKDILTEYGFFDTLHRIYRDYNELDESYAFATYRRSFDFDS